ncbi:uncharacterized protein LOC118743332 [Rhagoletis pomonella]|uniref:uncharacterized protein LOC118743332 n=1 Tax=Rhagoletis pomonella TaxID=28610 RepID=UPI001785663B|nr:uncharacterized protein LOC118743332 [Rhagoletis pomonella]
MKPNCKDSKAQVAAKTTATIGTTTAAAAAAAAVSTVEVENDERLEFLRENVSLIGWMGIIASTTMLLCTGLSMQWSDEVVRYFVYALRKSFEMERTRVMLQRVIMALSTSAYSLSAVNMLMNMFLLIGVAKLNYKLLLPWLLFHGFLFGLFVHVAIYATISSLLIDFRIFVLLVASLTIVLMIFYKISYEVFHLYKVLRRSSAARYQSVRENQSNSKNFIVLQSEV